MGRLTKDQFISIINDLLRECHAQTPSVEYHRMFDTLGDLDDLRFSRWATNIRFLIGSMGSAGGHLVEMTDEDFQCTKKNWERLEGVLLGIRDAVQKGVLSRIEDQVFAEAFAGLLVQADHLVENGYELAAGVLGRAVLEERLRTLCDRHGCLPAGRPTINDLNMALYKGQHLNKLAMQGVTAMATAGNHCAHNDKPPLPRAEVERFLRDVREFLQRHPT